MLVCVHVLLVLILLLLLRFYLLSINSSFWFHLSISSTEQNDFISLYIIHKYKHVLLSSQNSFFFYFFFHPLYFLSIAEHKVWWSKSVALIFQMGWNYFLKNLYSKLFDLYKMWTICKWRKFTSTESMLFNYLFLSLNSIFMPLIISTSLYYVSQKTSPFFFFVSLISFSVFLLFFFFKTLTNLLFILFPLFYISLLLLSLFLITALFDSTYE